MPRIGHALLLIFFFSLITTGALAQTRFVEHGRDAHTGVMNFGFTPEDISLAGSYSFIHAGRFEVGLFAGHSWLDEGGASGFFYGPAVGVGLMKPEKRLPLGFELTGSLEMSNFSSHSLEAYGVDLEGQVFRLDGALYAELEASPTVTFYPTFLLSYLKGDVEVGGNAWQQTVGEIDDLAYTWALSFVVRESMQLNFLATNFQDDWSGTISIGFLKLGEKKYRKVPEPRPEAETMDEELPF